MNIHLSRRDRLVRLVTAAVPVAVVAATGVMVTVGVLAPGAAPRETGGRSLFDQCAASVCTGSGGVLPAASADRVSVGPNGVMTPPSVGPEVLLGCATRLCVGSGGNVPNGALAADPNGVIPMPSTGVGGDGGVLVDGVAR